jgi:hypothetical protein
VGESQKQPAATVADLIRILSAMPPDAKVIGVLDVSGGIEDVILDGDTVVLDIYGGWVRDSIMRREAKQANQSA